MGGWVMWCGGLMYLIFSLFGVVVVHFDPTEPDQEPLRGVGGGGAVHVVSRRGGEFDAGGQARRAAAVAEPSQRRHGSVVCI